MDLMTYANIIPAGAALLTSGAAYLLSKYDLPSASTAPDLGYSQEYCRQAGAAETILKYINAPAEAHLRIMTDDFAKWNSSKEWMAFIEDRLKSGVTVTAFAAGSANKEVPDRIRSLTRDSRLEIVQCGDQPFEKHFTTISCPRQIWYEEYHVGHFATNCIYTRHPHNDVWIQIEAYFNLLKQKKV